MPPLPDTAPGDPVRLTVPARLVEVRRLAALLRALCDRGGIDEATAFECELALVEAANNVVEHGYAGRPEGEGELSVELTLATGALTIVLRDRGTPVPGARLAPPALAASDDDRGRGMAIIRTCVDELDYASGEDGNVLTLVRRLGG